ncbi:MAG: ABC transporter ATP-binding protein/permease [Bacilli bacterium]|nr:ABC transporter ATP-binding protein/permease [Bacilli bacterium]
MYRLENVSKRYGDFLVLKDISFSLPQKGLVAIKGRSGSGKSTLLNLMSLMEKPTEGKLFYKGVDTSTLKEKDKDSFRSFECAFVYQHFNLEEDLSVVQNVELPLELRDEKKQEIARKSRMLLEKFGLFAHKNKKVKVLSGGEKQRVALCRSIIIQPKVLFADEPTGALDKRNERIVMDALKELSKEILVVLVSHNERIISKYADHIIELSDGKIVSEPISFEEEAEGLTIRKKKTNYGFLSSFLSHNYKGNKIKNLLALASGALGYAVLLLALGFYSGSKEKIEEERSSSLLYTVANVSKKTIYAIEGSPLSLSRTLRPEKKEIKEAFKGFDVVIGNDYSYFLPVYNAYECNGFPKDPVAFCPINDLSLKDREKDFLVEGKTPVGESMSFALVNEEFEKNLGEKALGKIISINSKTNVSDGDVSDEVTLSFDFQVIGVVHEFPFLNIPRVYYSYPALSKEMVRTKLPNISKEKGESISVASFVNEAPPSSEYSSYSYLAFFKEKEMRMIEEKGMKIGELTLSSDPLTINQSFIALTEAFSGCLMPFMVIEVLGVAFILGSLSYSSFMERRKQAAILTALGGSQKDRSFIYEGEGFLNAFFSSLIALLLSYPLERLLSSCLESQTGMASLIKIPYFSYLGLPFLPVVGVILLSLMVALVSSALPLSFASKRPLTEELRDE